jgi:hypothetical protein
LLEDHSSNVKDCLFTPLAHRPHSKPDTEHTVWPPNVSQQMAVVDPFQPVANGRFAATIFPEATAE